MTLSTITTDDDIWKQIHSFNLPNWFEQYGQLLNQMPLEKKRIWQIFRDYNEGLHELQFFIISANAPSMLAIANATNEKFCVWPNYPFFECDNIVNGLYVLPAPDRQPKEWSYPVWEGPGLEGRSWCNTLFLPNTTSASEMSALIPNLNIVTCGLPCKTREEFSAVVHMINRILKKIPWLGFAVFLSEPVFYLHFLSLKQTERANAILNQLQSNNIPFGWLRGAGNNIQWMEFGDVGLW